MGDGRAQGSSAIGNGGKTAISLTPDIDGTGSGSLLDSILSALLRKQSSDVWVVALLFLIIDDTVALDCILSSCCNFCVPFYIWALCLKIVLPKIVVRLSLIHHSPLLPDENCDVNIS